MNSAPAKGKEKAGLLEGDDVGDIMKMVENHPMYSILIKSLPKENQRIMMLQLELILRGVTPDDYKSFYDIMEMTAPMLQDDDDDMDDLELDSVFDYDMPFAGKRKSAPVKAYTPLNNASELTLLLKIQMKGVVKPPMWREVEVPADWNYLRLHQMIQKVMGFCNCHLWRFNATAYDDSLVIGEKSHNDFESGLSDFTDEASATPLTKYLNRAGDRLEYIYDFGDDWIFTVEVKKVIEKKSECAVCTKLKSSLNPIEDTGGPWAYVDMRKAMDNWKSLKKAQRQEIAENAGYDSAEDFYDTLKDSEVTVDDLNEILKD